MDMERRQVLWRSSAKGKKGVEGSRDLYMASGARLVGDELLMEGRCARA